MSLRKRLGEWVGGIANLRQSEKGMDMGKMGKAELCLLAGAYGDAFGYAVEFDEWRVIKKRFGPDGMREFPAGADFVATDDTQMALFAAEALLEAKDLGDGETAIASARRTGSQEVERSIRQAMAIMESKAVEDAAEPGAPAARRRL